jgi:hypothetical protein
MKLAERLNLKVTPDILGLVDGDTKTTKELTDILVNLAIENGASEKQIEKAVDLLASE